MHKLLVQQAQQNKNIMVSILVAGTLIALAIVFVA